MVESIKLDEIAVIAKTILSKNFCVCITGNYSRANYHDLVEEMISFYLKK